MRFGIPQALPLGSKMPAEELAKAVNLPTDILIRIMRLGVCNGIFEEPERGWFGHSASSALLARSEHLRNIAVFGTHELSSALIKLPDALKQQQELGEKGPHAAFELAYPGYRDAFDYFNTNGEANSRYHTYLEGRVNTSRWAVHHLKSSWHWGSIGSSTVIDVSLDSPPKKYQSDFLHVLTATSLPVWGFHWAYLYGCGTSMP